MRQSRGKLNLKQSIQPVNQMWFGQYIYGHALEATEAQAHGVLECRGKKGGEMSGMADEARERLEAAHRLLLHLCE